MHRSLGVGFFFFLIFLYKFVKKKVLLSAFRLVFWLYRYVQRRLDTLHTLRAFQAYRRCHNLTLQCLLSCIFRPNSSKDRNSGGSLEQISIFTFRWCLALYRCISRLSFTFGEVLFPFFCTWCTRLLIFREDCMRIPSNLSFCLLECHSMPYFVCFCFCLFFLMFLLGCIHGIFHREYLKYFFALLCQELEFARKYLKLIFHLFVLFNYSLLLSQ